MLGHQIHLDYFGQDQKKKLDSLKILRSDRMEEMKKNETTSTILNEEVKFYARFISLNEAAVSKNDQIPSLITKKLENNLNDTKECIA